MYIGLLQGTDNTRKHISVYVKKDWLIRAEKIIDYQYCDR